MFKLGIRVVRADRREVVFPDLKLLCREEGDDGLNGEGLPHLHYLLELGVV